jgi:hypothetical protein
MECLETEEWIRLRTIVNVCAREGLGIGKRCLIFAGFRNGVQCRMYGGSLACTSGLVILGSLYSIEVAVPITVPALVSFLNVRGAE